MSSPTPAAAASTGRQRNQENVNQHYSILEAQRSYLKKTLHLAAIRTLQVPVCWLQHQRPHNEEASEHILFKQVIFRLLDLIPGQRSISCVIQIVWPEPKSPMTYSINPSPTDMYGNS